MPKQEYDNTNSGAIFVNAEKEELLKGNIDQQEREKVSKWPDRKGSLNVNGEEYWVSGWIKESKKSGEKFMSLSIKPKDQNAAPKTKTTTAAASDDDGDNPW